VNKKEVNMKNLILAAAPKVSGLAKNAIVELSSVRLGASP
jgi:hypothetical protein